jgi:hypothetical protein
MVSGFYFPIESLAINVFPFWKYNTRARRAAGNVPAQSLHARNDELAVLTRREFWGEKEVISTLETAPNRGPTQFVSIEILILIRGSEYDHHVYSQIMHMVRYGTQLLIVDNVDHIWQIHGRAQDVDRFLTFFCRIYAYVVKC